MRIRELIEWLNDLVPFTYFANEFPPDDPNVNVPDEAAYVTIQPGMGVDPETGVSRPNFQIVVRGSRHGMEALETKANEIFDAVTNQSEITIGTSRVVHIFAIGSAPQYMGRDANDRPHYAMNFRATIRPG